MYRDGECERCGEHRCTAGRIVLERLAQLCAKCHADLTFYALTGLAGPGLFTSWAVRHG